MAINPEEFLRFAHDTLDNKQEIRCRMSAARAYYYIYHTILDYVNSHPNIELLRNSGFHQSLINSLEAFGRLDKTKENDLAVELSKILYSTRSIRTKADYALHKNFPFSDSKYVLRLADKVKELLVD